VPISALFQTLQTKRQRHPWWGKACLPLARFWIIFKRYVWRWCGWWAADR
jgi:hypothetical protein